MLNRKTTFNLECQEFYVSLLLLFLFHPFIFYTLNYFIIIIVLFSISLIVQGVLLFGVVDLATLGPHSQLATRATQGGSVQDGN